MGLAACHCGLEWRPQMPQPTPSAAQKRLAQPGQLLPHFTNLMDTLYSIQTYTGNKYSVAVRCLLHTHTQSCIQRRVTATIKGTVNLYTQPPHNQRNNSPVTFAPHAKTHTCVVIFWHGQCVAYYIPHTA